MNRKKDIEKWKKQFERPIRQTKERIIEARLYLNASDLEALLELVLNKKLEMYRAQRENCDFCFMVEVFGSIEKTLGDALFDIGQQKHLYDDEWIEKYFKNQ